MILDQLESLGCYRGISENLDTAIDYLLTADLKKLANGSHQVDGERVLANVMTYETKRSEEGKFEAHRKYIDIQVVLEGEERCCCAPLSLTTELAHFDADKDVVFLVGPRQTSMQLNPDNFAIFFPQDAHMPSLNMDEACKVHKVVMKVAV
jgi:YhcH/YjgK/YiaL family protein